MIENHTNSSGDNSSRKHRWFGALLWALVVHGIGVVVFLLIISRNDEVQDSPTLIPVEMNEEARVPSKSFDFEQKKEGVRGEQTTERSSVPKRSARRRVRTSKEPVGFPPADEGETKAKDESSKADRHAKLDLRSNALALWKTASEDPRVRRARGNRDLTLLTDEKEPSKTVLPPGVPHEEIRRFVENSWLPDWEQIKDDGIAKVSGEWLANEVSNYVLNWQKNLKEAGKDELEGTKAKDLFVFNLEKNLGGNEEITTSSFDSMAYLADTDFASIRVSIEIDLEPLRNGGYAASIAKSSDHPFFDRQALEEVKKISQHFPPWIEGYGHALRYKLDADFTILPPTPSKVIGLNCAFPFCTKEELKELELVHWFAKSLNKNVHFKGLIAPPSLPDGGH